MDDTLLDICCLLECTRISLDVIEPSRGLLVGPIILANNNGVKIDCSLIRKRPVQEDYISEIVVTVAQGVKFILVVENEVVFCCLSQMCFHDEFNWIITSDGEQPDFSTRAFLRRL